MEGILFQFQEKQKFSLLKRFLYLIFILLVSHSCNKNDEEVQVKESVWTTKSFNYKHDGLVRSYILYKPQNFKKNSPLVFVLHGFGSSSLNIMSYSQMNLIAEENGFMVCYPQGSILPTGQSHWNANLEMSSVDDIGFLSNLAKEVQTIYQINPKNIFVSGMSNGGFMSYTLACEKSDVFKAIASITGTMSGKDWENCNPSFDIPVMQISGTNDRTVPWDGTMSTAYGWGGAPHIKQVVEFWADQNQCDVDQKINFPDIDVSDKSTVSLLKKKGSLKNNQVWFYTVDGGGHDWPGSWGNKDISATKEIWKFFSHHLK